MIALAFSDHGNSRSRLELALSRELQPDETVIWRGAQLARVSAKAFGLWIFAIPWTAFALFWVAMASAGATSAGIQSDIGIMAWAFPLFGVPFVLVGLAMLSAPFLPLWERGKVLYAVTSKRVIKVRLGRSLNVTSAPASRIGQIDRTEHRDATGSIRLAINIGRDSDGDKTVEHFNIGPVADIFDAQEALERLAEGPA